MIEMCVSYFIGSFVKHFGFTGSSTRRTEICRGTKVPKKEKKQEICEKNEYENNDFMFLFIYLLQPK